MMTDMGNELANEFQNPEEWGDPVRVPPRSAKRRLAAMVSVRLSPEELSAVQEQARSLGVTVSGYLRTLALEAVAGQKHPVAADFIANTVTEPSLQRSNARLRFSSVVARMPVGVSS